MRVQKSTVTTLGFIGLAALGAAQAEAQTSVTVGGREIQVHGFVQQGFVFTDDNSFLTMGSSNGSGEMTDGAFNVSSKLHDKVRIGAQVYARNLGQFGNGRVELDWVFADYQVNEKIGFRGGKVKTQLGLINDTQDMEFLHTWALLPQAVSPTRAATSTAASTPRRPASSPIRPTSARCRTTSAAAIAMASKIAAWASSATSRAMAAAATCAGRRPSTACRWACRTSNRAASSTCAARRCRFPSRST
jgi:hypothetical protein